MNGLFPVLPWRSLRLCAKYLKKISRQDAKDAKRNRQQETTATLISHRRFFVLFLRSLRLCAKLNEMAANERTDEKTENDLAAIVVDSSIHIHQQLGPGLLESAYEAILAYELGRQGLYIERQVPIPLIWNGMLVRESFRADLIVEKKLIIELKSIERLLPVHSKQVLTYLRITGLKLGLLLNFGTDLMKNGIVRLVNGLNE
jgi:GxxExxY protein